MIYDCFTFFNELDLLEIRLNELWGVVDKFVLVEATKTHQKQIKPLHYLENKNRFIKFSDKIIHIIVDNYPTFFTNFRFPTTWDYEMNQRNGISKGLKNCKPDDVIIISDIDEIPRPEKILQYKDIPGIKVFKQNMYYYFCNCINISEDDYWYGSVMTHFNNFATPQDYRQVAIMKNRRDIKKRLKLKQEITQKLGNQEIVVVENGGWHFSYSGGVEKIIEKLESFAHSEYNKNKYKNREKILRAINTGADIFGRNFCYNYVKLDETFPKYLIQNTDKFKHLIKEVWT